MLNGRARTKKSSGGVSDVGGCGMDIMGGDGLPGPGQVYWKVGLVNHHGKYLTAETFGYKVSAAATALRRKQLWIVEQDGTEGEIVYIRSHLGRYLAGDRKGNVTCCSESRGEAEKFVIKYHGDGSGRWAICNRVTGYYFGGTDDQLTCYEKQPGKSEWWTVHLAVHPQVNLRNVSRQKYARLDPTSEHLQVQDLIPWGPPAVVELEFRGGRYCIRTCDGRYLHRDGSLVDGPSPDTMFAVELRSVVGAAVGDQAVAGMALRDVSGRYLTAVGRDAVVRSRNGTIGKDELFVVEDSQPQVFFTAHNQKTVSIRQGVNVTAILYQEDELTDKETFQVEFEKRTDQWRVRTADNTYWVLVESGSGIQSTGNARSPTGLFGVDWLPDGAVALRAANGRYVTARMNGSLNAIADSVSDRERFRVTIINRPQLVLRCEHGYLGLRGTRYECNRTAHDVVYVEHPTGDDSGGVVGGVYYLKGHNNKYLTTDVDGNLVADDDEPQPFVVELRGQSKMAVRAPNDRYVRGDQNGTVTASGLEPSAATLWEY